MSRSSLLLACPTEPCCCVSPIVNGVEERADGCRLSTRIPKRALYIPPSSNLPPAMEITITGDASKVASQNLDVGMLERAPR